MTQRLAKIWNFDPMRYLLDTNVIFEFRKPRPHPGVVAWLNSVDQEGKTMPAVDSLIAAAALQGGLVLVTRNVNDFRYAGLQLFNPWEN